jgi:ATP-dependent RNA circularization protein (DNA/RNA ligase family)
MKGVINNPYDGFYKFPSTPHLLWLGKTSPRDDKVYSKIERRDFLNGEIIVEEKIDGANIGISLNASGEIAVQNRNNYITKAHRELQFEKLWDWMGRRKYILKEFLHQDLIIFGEWCYAKHSVFYDRLPDWFLGFDIYDIEGGFFWASCKRNDALASLNIATVPHIAKGYFSVDDLLKMINKSHYSDTSMEGIYLRNENDEILLHRAKVVNPIFAESINSHWKKSAFIRNCILKK